MRDETEEEIIRELDSETPPMTGESEHTLRNLARLAQLIATDTRNASQGPESERQDALHEIERKARLLSDWLIRKADECAREHSRPRQ